MSKLFMLATLLLVGCFAFLLISTALQMSPVWDEPNAIALGYYFLKTHDYKLNMGHPPLGFMISALPLLLTKAQLPDNASSYVSYAAFSNAFFSKLDNVKLTVFLARLPSIILTVTLSVLVLFWSLRLYGRAAALFSAALFVFNASVIGNSVTAVNDVIVSFFIFLTLLLFWLYLKSQKPLLLAFFVISFSTAVLTKLTGLFILPMLFLIGFLTRRKYRIRLKSIGVALCVAFFLMAFLVFAFQFGSIKNFLPERQVPVLEKFITHLPKPLHTFSEAAISVPIPFPSFFVSAMQGAVLATFAPKTSFLFGNIYEGGRWYYFPVEFVLKNSLFFLITLIVASAKKIKLEETFLIVPSAIYFLLFLPLNENFGIRHLLPIFPFLCVFCGRLLQPKNSGIHSFLTSCTVVAALIINIAAVHPYEFSYFIEPIKANNGYHYLVDGNLDQGQDLIALKKYLDEHSIQSIKLSYFGSINPSLYGINYTYLPSPYWQAWNPNYAPSLKQLPAGYVENCTRTSGIIAISATNLQNVHLINKNCYGWLREHEPIGKAGYSIFIYDIREEKP